MGLIPSVSRTILSLFLISFVRFGSSDPSYFDTICQNTANYTTNSTYASNLKLLLSSNSSLHNGYFNSTAGQYPDRTYGSFLCRGDVTKQVCQDCVQTASRDIVQRCPNKRVAFTWYDECLLRYSNRSFFSIMDEEPQVYLNNSNNLPIQDRGRFDQLLEDGMNSLADRAAFDPSLRMFGTVEVKFPDLGSMYSLVQCTPDLSGSDCNKCLRDIVAQLTACCRGSIGSQIHGPSCSVRYEVYRFYNMVPSPPLPLPQNRTSTTGVSNEIQDTDSLQCDLDTIKRATDNFSSEYKIGECGFGDVYKGTLSNGQQIAVKRLSENSGQGREEFRNEVALVTKLEHRNLVRVLGFCLEGKEKILIYEFVPNKSLDYYLFEPEKMTATLDWPSRYKIIERIAGGMRYLHEDSQVTIIHRDLKASNILLDGDMNPKISDFGMARIFKADQSQGITKRMVGSFGYMAPEYAMQGQFSAKSDVYSFGVLVLEIISGKNNNSFYQSDCGEDLLSYAWRHWNQGTALELLDPNLGDCYSSSEAMRCIHIGLLCTQENVGHRPTMASVVLMVNSYSVTLPSPWKPGFRTRMESGQTQK